IELSCGNFLCSICLSVFNKPVSTPCGHNFCLDCITNFWETKHTAVKCPLCNETFDSIPKLRVNTVIAEMAAKLKRAVQENPPTTTEQMIRVRQQKIQEIQDSVEASRNNAAKVKDWSDVTLNSNVYAMEGAMTKLVTSVKREISMLCDPDLKKMEQHAVDVTLDPDTANPWLIVSEDGKQVTHGDRKRNLPNKPERFDHVLNVLAKEGFSSGKFYYEVQVKEKTHWDLGVAKESINRKGDIRLSPQNGYWTILLKKGYGFTANAGPAINLHVREMPQKIGVFVDYEEGQVSFYNVDSRAKIFSFTGCNFTEKLFPFFSPCANDGGKNSAPLIITPIKYNS
uniref:Bloodthirsty-related gene family, member 2 n=1 Tax=Monopterus albus TaxID=43700 RepID=A0A3Q3J1H0_MONAL